MLREADKQNYNNNGRDDNEDRHQCPIWPSWHHKGRVGEGEEKSVKCLESWIRYIWLQNILRHETTVPGPGEGEKTWVGHGVTCQMPTNITFTDNFCFLSKVLRNTSQRPGTLVIDLDTKNTNPNTLQLGDYRNRHWLCRFTFFNPLFRIS